MFGSGTQAAISSQTAETSSRFAREPCKWLRTAGTPTKGTLGFSGYVVAGSPEPTSLVPFLFEEAG